MLACIDPALFLENFGGIASLMAAAGADFAVIAPLYTVMSLGWGAGKFAAVAGGAGAVKTFSQLNCLPMAGFVAISHKYEDQLGVGVWGAFLAAYLYIGFVEKPKKK